MRRFNCYTIKSAKISSSLYRVRFFLLVRREIAAKKFGNVANQEATRTGAGEANEVRQ